MKNIILIFLVGIFAFSCSTDGFEDLNTDKKNPSEIPAEPLFTNALRNLVDQMTECSVNFNVFRLYGQYWAQTTYPDESQYNMVARKNPDAYWNVLYRDVLRDLQETNILLDEQVTTNSIDEAIKNNKKNIIEILEVYSYSVLVDIFGDVPYSEALNKSIINPTYDDAAAIYSDLFTRLTAAVAALNTAQGSFGSSEDLVYGGDVAAWKKFGNSLLLKMAIRVADADSAKAKSVAESVASSVFSSSADNFSMVYLSSSPNTNPLWVQLIQSGRNDFVPANTIVDVMNSLNDPRRGLWFDLAGGSTYIGGEYGAANAYSSFSHLATIFEDPTLPGTLLSYSEVEFLLAEAAARGFNVGGTAESHYNNAITASIMDWGGSQAMADTYLAQSSVAYASAAGDWKNKIGVQKWISLIDNGFEGWTTYRKFDFGFFNIPDGLTASDIPQRMIYPIDEATLNGANLKAAAAKYGGDVVSAKIFWDKN